VDYVAHFQGLDLFVDHQLGEDVLICVRTDMKIAWDLFDGKRPCKPAAIVFPEGISGHFILFHMVGFPQQLEIPCIYPLPIGIKAILLN
jgi:hypothetical protein